MINRVKRVLVGCAVVAFGTSLHVCAQNELEALLQDLNGANEEPAQPAVAEEQPVDPAPAPVVEQEPPVALTAVDADEPKAVEVAEVSDDDAALISELAALEILRRGSMDEHAMRSLESANALLLAGDNLGARDQYKQTLNYLSNRPANETARQAAEKGMGEAYYNEARLMLKQKDLEAAQSMAYEAVQLGHPKGARLLETVKKEIAVGGTVVRDASAYTHRVNEETYKERQDEIRTRLRRSRQFFTTAEFPKALEECEIVLRDYPDNMEAIELRRTIVRRMNTIATEEFETTRTAMIKDVTASWTPPRYAHDSAQAPKGGRGVGEGESRKPVQTEGPAKQLVSRKLREIVIPEVTFRPPATIIDAVEFFKQASRDYDSPEIPVDQRGVNLILKLPATAASAPVQGDIFSAPSSGVSGVPVIPAMSARFISLYDALKLVCDVTSMKIRVTANVVMIVPTDDPDDELTTRSYNVLPTLIERVGNAASTLSRPTAGAGAGGYFSTEPLGTEKGEDDLKAFFMQMGVKWPTGSSISYLSAIGKLRVQNTADQLAVFEQILEDLNVTPRLVEIEARFVEVAQEDLNSLGFEWMLNGDYSFSVGGFAKNLLGLKNVSNVPRQLTDASGTPLFSDTAGQVPLMGYGPYMKPGWMNGSSAYGYDSEGNLKPMAVNGYGMVPAARHNMGVNPIDGVDYATRNRYLSTMDNPISGKDKNIPDQFMRLNAFVGGADISMILHMLSQRSDTDLLSAPKVTTNPGQEAIIKVVTEYIYPSEFRVQISQQGTSGGGNTISGGGTGDPVAIVEPQNFTMREVGVILQVIPEVSSEGQMINLTMKPQVVSEPVWKNYGTRLPKTTYQPSGIPGISDAITEYIELPMEQPFFNVRSVETQLSIYNGATVVMGGLITESRQTIEDKIPFLGDIPFLGRLFRSRAEQTTKRNLLIFVTASLVDSEGRKIRFGGDESPLVSSGGSQTSVMTPDGDVQ